MRTCRNARESMEAFEEMKRRLVRVVVAAVVTLFWLVVLLP